ncbi:transmembrane protein 208-like [Anneissia japonica]|uniref:transmembrane protein 208-like n=1 Tax=Anneissia japonica TaxID=1529436 RepID=UPI0014259260|nr:transmembrane protein 208-like [Anneissia japonica]
MPPKGKPKTKGQKQIYLENNETLKFYSSVMGITSGLHIVFRLLWFYESFLWYNWVLLILSVVTYFGCYKLLSSMAKATFSETGTLVDGGIDLNMESGMAEHIKDIILLTAIVQFLGIFSDYFWLLWLLGPIRAFYLVWVNFLSPWFFAPPPPEDDEKKMRKKERKVYKRY